MSSHAPTLPLGPDATVVDLPGEADPGPATLSNAATLIAHDRGAPGDTLLGVTGNHRSTVLPRLELVGDIPQLISDNRLRFEEKDLLGRGGVGEVLLAHDNDIERAVAVKRLLPDLQRPAMVGRFVEEIRTLGRLDHPNIVPIHDVGTDADGRFYYVMKYVEGETLEGIIEKLAAGDAESHRKYTFERRLEIFQGILRALQYAHAQGIIHRDLKPANVMVGRFGEVMLMDWGLARRIRDDAQPVLIADSQGRPSQSPESPKLRTMVGAVLGTPAYMSPEQAQGLTDKIDERSDIYALCVMFHELMGLRHYLHDMQTVTETLAAVVSREVPNVREFQHPAQPPVPAEYGWFVTHGVAKDPAKRYRSITEMIARIQAIEEGKIPVECMHTMMKRMSCEMAKGVDKSAPTMLVGVLTVLVMGAFGLAALVWALSH
ncbi:MAG: serine/threonine protein kinase [Myxococcales bacterium]|nr:serine/threonine protein kinase [Myxococcales bacterium]